jgi:hypothetical protein
VLASEQKRVLLEEQLQVLEEQLRLVEQQLQVVEGWVDLEVELAEKELMP